MKAKKKTTKTSLSLMRRSARRTTWGSLLLLLLSFLAGFVTHDALQTTLLIDVLLSHVSPSGQQIIGCGESGCGLHGSCLVNRCICDPTHTGQYCQEESSTSSSPYPECRNNKRFATTVNSFQPTQLNDRCWNTREGYGRLRVESPARARLAHSCEASFWETTSVPERNPHQLTAFQHFQALPKDLGHVIEFGAGPYTKTRLILEQQQARSVQSVTLIDPLAVSEYIMNPKITSSYQNGTLCVSGGCITPTFIGSFAAEQLLSSSTTQHYYDTAIMINTIEHCENAVLVLDNVYRSLKPNGILVFGEEYASERQLRENDPCHPIRITKEFYLEFLNDFFGPHVGGEFLLGPLDGKDIREIPTSAGGSKTSLYAIVRKPI